MPQAGKTIDSFFDLLAGRDTYPINGLSLPLQARACSWFSCRVPVPPAMWWCPHTGCREV